MGKGDQRSRRGKIYRGTHGKRRPKKKGTMKMTVPETFRKSPSDKPDNKAKSSSTRSNKSSSETNS